MANRFYFSVQIPENKLEEIFKRMEIARREYEDCFVELRELGMLHIIEEKKENEAN